MIPRPAPTPRAAALPLVLLLLSSACGEPAVGAASPTSVPATASVTATTSASAPGDAKDGQVVEQPELSKFFVGMRACTRSEAFRIKASTSVHEYGVSLPAMDRAEVEASFKTVAGELGYTMRAGGRGPSFADEDKGVLGSLAFPELRIAVRIPKSALRMADERSKALGFESSSLITSILTDEADVRIESDQQGGHSLGAMFVIDDAIAAAAEKWATAHGLTKSARGWFRPPTTPDGRAILMIVRKKKDRLELGLAESRGVKPTGDGCLRPPPVPTPTPGASSSANAPPIDHSKFNKDQEDLLEQMMGGKE